jgi:hypothetical protein
MLSNVCGHGQLTGRDAGAVGTVCVYLVIGDSPAQIRSTALAEVFRSQLSFGLRFPGNLQRLALLQTPFISELLAYRSSASGIAVLQLLSGFLSRHLSLSRIRQRGCGGVQSLATRINAALEATKPRCGRERNPAGVAVPRCSTF